MAGSKVMLSTFGASNRRLFASRVERYPWKEKVASPLKQEANARLASLARLLLPKADSARERGGGYQGNGYGKGKGQPTAPPSHSNNNGNDNRNPGIEADVDEDRWALVLDAPSLSSARAIGQLYRPDHIVVPNDGEAKFGRDAANQAVVLGGCSLNAYLVSEAQCHGHGPFSCVFCDFTSCLKGSWRPSQELESLEAFEPLEISSSSASSSSSSGWCAASPAEDLTQLLLGGPQGQGWIDRRGAVLAVTLAHLRNPGKSRPQKSPNKGPVSTDQWDQLRLMIGALAAKQGLAAVSVPWRIEQTSVATEFWLLGDPRSKLFQGAVSSELERWTSDLSLPSR